MVGWSNITDDITHIKMVLIYSQDGSHPERFQQSLQAVELFLMAKPVLENAGIFK